VQERLVVAGLELVGADEEPAGLFLDAVGDVVRGEPVERRLGDLVPPPPPYSCSPEKATMAR
jgi:hypothetical protein